MQATQNSMQSFIGNFKSFMQNPMQTMMQNSIPKEMASDPNKAIQYLMDTGRISQSQYMQAKQMVNQIMGNPGFKQFFK